MAHRQEIPKRIGRLDELAMNLWWSWHEEARQLFRVLSYPLWRLTGHNPVKMLRHLSPQELEKASRDADFLNQYDRAIGLFDSYMSPSGSRTQTRQGGAFSGPVAYFSMEFAIHNSLPIYAGGLGILAGDTCKEASDLGVPFAAVGFMYPQGYFVQRINAQGWQEEIYQQLDFDEAPVRPLFSPNGERLLVSVEFPDRLIYAGVWQVKVGRTNLYLLDTDVEKNPLPDRSLSARLYTADREQRLQQEVLLGFGGVRALKALGIKPSVWHANEGHTTFMILERIGDYVKQGMRLDEASTRVRQTTIFTTHTPVAAGHDFFANEMVSRYLERHTPTGLGQEQLLEMGRISPGDRDFNMAVLGLKTAGYRNGVSQLHERVTKNIWHILWPDLSEGEVPISHVTNGIHVPTWVAHELMPIYGKYLGSSWLSKQDEAQLWQCIRDIPDGELWSVHQILKGKLLTYLDEQIQKCYKEGTITAEQCIPRGALLSPEALTIGFVRRFTQYKRPDLVLSDAERLKRIIADPLRPVQIIFAGKPHPSDFPAKQILQQVYTKASDSQGRIVFVEDYDIHLAHYLTQGVDVWLNTPLRLNEACGTSGMKASLNGVPHLSISDGWWYEGYNGKNGWKIGDDSPNLSPGEQYKRDAQSLYEILENQVVPLFYKRDERGVPIGWMHVMKEAIASVVPAFCAQRMLKQYVEKMYLPAARSQDTGGKT